MSEQGKTRYEQLSKMSFKKNPSTSTMITVFKNSTHLILHNASLFQRSAKTFGVTYKVIKIYIYCYQRSYF